MTSCAIRAAGGASATHGDLAVTSKNTDPDSCTAERTSDSASVLIAKTLREKTDLSATHPDTEVGSQDGRATTIAGLDVRARGPASEEAHERGRWITPAAPIRILPMRYRCAGQGKRLLRVDNSQLLHWREIPEHGSDQQERRHVTNQVTHLVSVIGGLCCHDAGVHDAGPDGE